MKTLLTWLIMAAAVAAGYFEVKGPPLLSQSSQETRHR